MLRFFMKHVADIWWTVSFLKNLNIQSGNLKHIYSSSDDLEIVSYQDARNLILGAIDFAKAIKIAPYSSWNGVPSSFIFGHEGTILLFFRTS